MNFIGSTWHRINILRQKALQVERSLRHGRIGSIQSELATSAFAVEAARYSCPIIRPQSQLHLFQGKMQNLRLALSRCSPIVLRPGELFSFWALVKAPKESNGYVQGPSFLHRRVSSALGGGLCQLSGLLYNLALLSNCRILERHPHSIDAYGDRRYIPLGRDATVAYGWKDLVFSNPHSFPLRLDFDLNEERLTGYVKTNEEFPFEVEIQTELLEQIPSPMICVGDEVHSASIGFDGKRVKASRTIRALSSRVDNEELLSVDYYRETPSYIASTALSESEIK